MRTAVPRNCQVYTSASLARAMVRKLLENPRQRWLEPSCGQGVFLRALLDNGVSPAKVTCVEISPPRKFEAVFANRLVKADFLEWASNGAGRFDCVVGNPPYVPLRVLPSKLRKTALETTDIFGRKVVRSSNYWYAFINSAIALLRDGGSVGFVLPASYEYADYSKDFRLEIAKRFHTVEVHRSEKPLFKEVQEGCVVLIAKGYGRPAGTCVRRIHSDERALVTHLSGRLKRSAPAKTTDWSAKLGKKIQGVEFADIFQLRIGGVTGDSKYFLFTEAERLEWNIPRSSFQRVLTRSSQLTSPFFNLQSWTSLLKSNQRVWLFRPSETQAKEKSVQAYLRQGREDCNRESYKIRNRNPWYQTPLPLRVDGFLSGMSGVGPWICLNEVPKLSATNTLYVVRFRDELSRPEKAAWAMMLLTSDCRRQLVRSCRIYADGLRKYEPGDINLIRLPKFKTTRGAVNKYREAVSLLLSGNVKESSRLADSMKA